MKRLIIAGLITFIVIMVATFPARVAYTLFAPAQLQLSGIAGSVWNGTATEGVAGGAYVRDISWKFKPASLLSGELGFTTSSRPMSGTLITDLAVNTSGTLTLSALSGNLPLDLVHPAIQQSGMRGDLHLEFEKLVIRDGIPVEAEGSVTIIDFFSPALSASRIGDFRADFRTEAGAITARVVDINGVLEVDGSITLNQDRSFAFLGLVAATAATPTSIRDQLRFLGSANARGQHEFRFEGQL